MTQEVSPVTLYNCSNQQVIGIFSTQMLLKWYLFPASPYSKITTLNYCIMNKTRINKTIFAFPVTARYANAEQLEKLNGNVCFIADGYPIVHANKQKGFSETSSNKKAT